MQDTQPQLLGTWKRLAETFARERNITATVAPAPADQGIRFGADTPLDADVVQIHSFFLPLVMARGQLLPLSPFLPARTDLSASFPTWCADAMGAGPCRAIPTTTVQIVLFARQDTLDRLSLSPDALAGMDFPRFVAHLAAAPSRRNPPGPLLASVCSFLQFLAFAGLIGTGGMDGLARLPRKRTRQALDGMAPFLQDPTRFHRGPLDGALLQRTCPPLLLTGANRQWHLVHRKGPPWHCLPVPTSRAARYPLFTNWLCAARKTPYPDLAAEFIAAMATRTAQQQLNQGGLRTMQTECQSQVAAEAAPTEHIARHQEAWQRAGLYPASCRMGGRPYHRSLSTEPGRYRRPARGCMPRARRDLFG